MRLVKSVLAVAFCIVLISAVAFAGQNQFGVADVYKINFVEKTRVADTLLPSGNYEIRHVMEGSEHIMVFRQVGVKKPVEVRAKCTLVPLADKAADNQKIYELNAANERVLHELIFKGDRAKHVF
ncbi:MAG TPA: hypothetical protein VL983_10510 [Terriglobales bacterium]|nr:hypothetical protein [Terriglobales bacterium]